MKENSKYMLAGKIFAAVSAIVLAGCLISNEQKKKNEDPQLELTHISSSKSITYDTLVQDLSRGQMYIKEKNETLDVSRLSQEKLDELLQSIEYSRLSPEFFATSKSLPPRGVNSIFYIETWKDGKSENLNLTKMSLTDWKVYKENIKNFHKTYQRKDTFIHSSKAPVFIQEDKTKNKK